MRYFRGMLKLNGLNIEVEADEKVVNRNPEFTRQLPGVLAATSKRLVNTCVSLT